VETKFLNQDAMIGMLNFGKGAMTSNVPIEINDEMNLVVFQYYDKGEWDYY
jgi:hypothetical protein